ncbi:hypothetical protein BDY21DRAFT_336110 [Lineolata rhizophorae]|uniref:Secreted protein n=1 Tax=Lineolata rhizophorae TaxID=578093 RepID=A0A6A6PB90_9PEZI|nr:hypothetical protein BDY21DRAFT_336110 [Lineolata rhizophorae]
MGGLVRRGTDGGRVVLLALALLVFPFSDFPGSRQFDDTTRGLAFARFLSSSITESLPTAPSVRKLACRLRATALRYISGRRRGQIPSLLRP